MFTVISVSVYTYIYHTHFNSYVFSGINIPQQIYLCIRNAHFAGFVHFFFFLLVKIAQCYMSCISIPGATSFFFIFKMNFTEV